mgnify:CR=1 FL=1
MYDLISIFEGVVNLNLFVIDRDSSIEDGFLIVFRRVSSELFDESSQEGFSDPPAFREGSIGVGVWLNESKGETMDVDRFWLVLLHIIIFLVY